MPILSRFRIVKPRLERARVDVKPYIDYGFGNAFPESLFDIRIEALQTHVRQKFPFVHPILDRLALLFSILGCIYLILFLVLRFMNINVNSPKGGFEIPSPTLLVLVPIASYLAFYLGLKWKMKRGLKVFESSLNALLKQFTAADLPSQNIKWIYRRRIKRRTGQVRMSIYILQGDSEQEVDTLPLYREEYDDSPIEEGGPPGYDDVMALARVETGEEGWLEGGGMVGHGSDSFEYLRPNLGSQVGLVVTSGTTSEVARLPESVMVDLRGLPPGYRESL